MSDLFRFSAARRWTYAALCLLFVVVLLTGCSRATPAAPATPEPAATIAPTQTVEPTITPTRKPTNTPTPNRTAQAAETATKVAADALKEVSPELETLGVTAEQGQIVWMQKKAEKLSVDEYLGSTYTLVSDQKLTDFIVHTDVTWNTSGGLAGCAILFRTDSKDMNDGGSYHFNIMRLQLDPIWDVEYIKLNKWQKTLTNGRIQHSQFIQDKQDSTNKLTLVVHGDTFIPYINGEKMMTVHDKKLTEGYLAFGAWQESGKTSCSFANSWLWLPASGGLDKVVSYQDGLVGTNVDTSFTPVNRPQH